MASPIKQQPFEKRIHAKFYATESGNEPVKESLLELGRPIKSVHFFQKKTQKTPKSDLDLAWDRMKKWVRTQKDFERSLKKRK